MANSLWPAQYLYCAVQQMNNDNHAGNHAMKFAHIADAHLGSWREPKLREANAQSFCTAIARCIEEKADFVIIAGDLFDTASAPFEPLRTCVQKLKELKDNNIPVYIVPGSHDFSPSGKTMIDIIEHAGLATNIARGEVTNDKLKLRFTTDRKTGTKITGLPGKKGGLEKQYYRELAKEHLEAEKGPKIFVFHSAVSELQPEDHTGMEAMPLSLLPRGFDYYAGGHVHAARHEKPEGYKDVVYPGPVFPNNFAEMEKLGCGSFVIWDNGLIRHEKIILHPVVRIIIDAQNKSSAEISTILESETGKHDFSNAIVLLRASGTLASGKPNDINFGQFIDACTRKGAYAVLKNTHKLESIEFGQIKVSAAGVEEIEDTLIKENTEQAKTIAPEKAITMTKELLRILAAEKGEGERNADFEKRISTEVDKLLGL
jgi:hypothetical protein